MPKPIFFVAIVFIALLASSATSANIQEYTFGNIMTKDSSVQESADTGYNEIIFVGDVMLARKVDFYIQSMDPNYPFLRLPNFAGERSQVVGNFESSVPQIHVPTPFMTFRFSTPVSALSSLQYFGFTHLSLANNHSYDYGEDGFINTKVELERIGITPFGSPRDIDTKSYVSSIVNGKRVAVISFDLVTNTFEEEKFRQLVHEVQMSHDILIVYVHWGEEYSLTHSNGQYRVAEFVSSLGVDAIIGHHPHVVQDIQLIEGVPVFFSLGNFVFDQYFSQSVQEGLVIKMAVDDTSHSFALIPVTSVDQQSSPRAMDGDESSKFLQELAKRSDAVLQDGILNGEIVVTK